MKKISSKKANRGITLVALVITIIILLILAGISIKMLSGEDGIISKILIAKEKNKIESTKEKLNTFIDELQIEKMGNAKLKDLEKLEKEGKVQLETQINENTEYVNVAIDDFIFCIDTNFNIKFLNKMDSKINISLKEENGNIIIKISGKEDINAVKIIDPNGNVYTKEVEKNCRNIELKYQAIMSGNYQIEVIGNNENENRIINLPETQNINEKEYNLIYGIQDLDKFISRVLSGETGINAKLMGNINDNLYTSYNCEFIGVEKDENKFVTTTNDPIIRPILNEKLNNVSGVYIEFEEELPQDMLCEIFFNENNRFNEQQKKTQKIPKGTKKAIINIPNGNYYIRYDLGNSSNLKYEIKSLGYITDNLKIENWEKFKNKFTGQLMGDSYEIILMGNKLEYIYENLFLTHEKGTNHLSIDDNIATITGNDPYVYFNYSLKNVCGLKVDLNPNVMQQYFWKYDNFNYSEGNSKYTTSTEISIEKRDYTGLRFDFYPSSQNVKVNGLYCKYCVDEILQKYDENESVIEEWYAKGQKVKENSNIENSNFKNLILENISPNI